MRDVLDAIRQDDELAAVRRAENRARFPEIAAVIDEIRAAGGTAKLVWAANQAGDRIGPVPEGWDKDWPEVPAPVPPPRRSRR